MDKVNIKINKILLKNFKNVKNGVIKLDTNVIGVYGQNGSGKTALVDAFKFLKLILSGEVLPQDVYNYISIFENSANIDIDFYIKTKEGEYLVSYCIEFTKNENGKAIISKEKLYYINKNAKRKIKIMIADYDISYERSLKPEKQFKNFLMVQENIVNLKVTQRLCMEKCKSFLFNVDTWNLVFSKSLSDISKNILSSLQYFARCNLFVISNENNGLISINITLPVQFRKEEGNEITAGNIGVLIKEPTLIEKKTFDLLETILKQMNLVLDRIVPGLQLKLFDYGEEFSNNGVLIKKIEILSVKGDRSIPIRYESEGIKKIISILSALIAMYNNPSVCLIVDEFDAGVYEFLLGEILEAVSQSGKGQLLFTSHNLRPLEVLHKNSFYITTTNENNRYIKFMFVKKNNNLRDFYIRSINLGGQNEELYQETNQFDIQRAFRLAGEAYGKK